MLTLAKFKSVNTPIGLQIFRYETVFVSEQGAGDVIGLVYMMNPGDARPKSDAEFDRLLSGEYNISDQVLTEPDKTMKKVIKYIRAAYEHNGIELPETFTIEVENLFNLREKNSYNAKRLARQLSSSSTASDILFKHRQLQDKYQFVWLAWGLDDMDQEVQSLSEKYSNVIIVRKKNYKRQLCFVDYPLHPLYMNKRYFLEAAASKIKTGIV